MLCETIATALAHYSTVIQIITGDMSQAHPRLRYPLIIEAGCDFWRPTMKPADIDRLWPPDTQSRRTATRIPTQRLLKRLTYALQQSEVYHVEMPSTEPGSTRHDCSPAVFVCFTNDFSFSRQLDSETVSYFLNNHTLELMPLSDAISRPLCFKNSLIVIHCW